MIMSSPLPAAAAQPNRRLWPKLIGFGAAGLLVLLGIAYFAATSAGFLKGFVLPRVSQTLHADITVSDATISPFSEIRLQDLKVQAVGQEPLVLVPEIRIRYHLMDFLKSQFRVQEIAVESPVLALVENPDGSSNLDPILKALAAKPAAAKPEAGVQGAQPPLIDLQKLTISHASLRKVKNYAAGKRDLISVTNLNLSLTGLGNNQKARLQIDAGLGADNHPPAGGDAFLSAVLSAAFELGLTADLQPGWVSGRLQVEVPVAGGGFADLATFRAGLDCRLTPAEIEQLSLRFQKGGEALGELTVSGPFAAAKQEGRLQVVLRGVDRRLLNLAGARTGLDFGSTTIDSTNTIQFEKAGAVLAVAGNLDVGRLQVTRAGQATPVLDLSLGYDLSVDRSGQVATLRGLRLSGQQEQRELVSIRLAQPMSVGWGGGTTALPDASMALVLTNLNLADWKPFLGGVLSSGSADLNLNLKSRQGGKQIGFSATSQISNLALRLGGNEVSQVGVALQLDGDAAELQRIHLAQFKVGLLLQGQPAADVSVAGNYDLKDGKADLQLKLHALLARLLKSFPQPAVDLSTGELGLGVRLTQTQAVQSVTGDLTVTNLSGQVGGNALREFATALHLDLSRSGDRLEIREVAGSLCGGSGGRFEISGLCGLTNQSADVKLKLVGVNQNALQPFLQPLLADKKMVSVSINSEIAAQYHPPGASVVRGSLEMTNLVVIDPQKGFPATPLAIGLLWDASLAGQSAQVRQLQLSLTPTDRATNQVTLSGEMDFSRPAAVRGNLTLAADSLDLTRYYDLFAGGVKATNPPVAAAKTSSANTAQEPPPVFLPLTNFTAMVQMNRIYLHEIELTNFLAALQVDGARVSLSSFRFALNGAPFSVTALMDLGVVGYRYDLKVDGRQLPLAPLVDTFQPARKGQLGGTFSAQAAIKGAGITGPSLQTNLTGQFSVGLTNLALSVVNIQSPLLKSLINVVGTVPELLSNPGSALSSLLGNKGAHASLIDELRQSPIEMIAASGSVGNGRMLLAEALVRSAVFEAGAQGTLTLASVLTNSTLNFPVSVSLSQSLARRFNLAGASTNSAYVPLPQFLTMTHTLGAPKAEINKMALAGTALKSLGGGILTPGGTNGSPVGNLLNQFLRPK